MSTISATGTRNLIYDAIAIRLKSFDFQMLGSEGLFQRKCDSLIQRITILSDVLTGATKQYLICTANLSVQEGPEINAAELMLPKIQSPNTRNTVIQNIGYLLPQRSWKEWMIQLHLRVQPEITNFANTIAQVGIAWFEKFENRELNEIQPPKAIEHRVASYYRAREEYASE